MSELPPAAEMPGAEPAVSVAHRRWPRVIGLGSLEDRRIFVAIGLMLKDELGGKVTEMVAVVWYIWLALCDSGSLVQLQQRGGALGQEGRRRVVGCGE